MFDRILKIMREKLRQFQYVMTTHAEEEMDDDELTIFDVQHVIFRDEIVERQKDYHTNDWKYLIEGKTSKDEVVVVVAKLSLTGKLIIITVYVE